MSAQRLLPTVFALAFAVVLAVGQTAQAQDTSFRFYDYGNGLGINGYDPVAYFTKKKALKGKSAHKSEFGDRSWRFVNAKHKRQFDADPQKYLPAYGGHCAYGASRGYLVRGSPKAWTVHKDRLYLNYNLGVRTTWQRNIDGNIAKADRHWVTLKDQ